MKQFQTQAKCKRSPLLLCGRKLENFPRNKHAAERLVSFELKVSFEMCLGSGRVAGLLFCLGLKPLKRSGLLRQLRMGFI